VVTKAWFRSWPEREKGASLISTVCEENKPRGDARKRLMQVALGVNQVLFSDVPFPLHSDVPFPLPRSGSSRRSASRKPAGGAETRRPRAGAATRGPFPTRRPATSPSTPRYGPRPATGSATMAGRSSCGRTSTARSGRAGREP